VSRLLIGVLLLAGCATLPRPTLADATAAGVTLAELERGHDATIERCSSCHLTPSPRDHTPAEWPALVDRMATNAHLSGNERDDIVRYLITVRSHS
jgi:hypothetical protein